MLYELLKDIEYRCIQGSMDREIKDICTDSKKVKSGDLFVCINGSQYNAHDYIDEVIDKGCQCIVIDEEVIYKDHITYIYVKNTKEAYAYICRNYFNNPSGQLVLIGITGTKGKTTLTSMLYQTMNKYNKTGMIGTMGILYDKYIDTKNTTPDSYIINKYLREMADCGYQYCIIEVSSLGVYHHRITGLLFDIGVLTNISSDHIGKNEHPSYEHYKECKYSFLKQCRHVILNQDDNSYTELKESIKEYSTYSLYSQSDIIAYNITQYKKTNQLGVVFHTRGLISHQFSITIPGLFNVYNALALISICHKLNIKYHTDISIELKGRCELLKNNNNYYIMIDYAHNKLSYTCLLEMLKDYQFHRIIAVYGAGGNRDHTRRYDIGRLMAKYGVYSIVTMDNPRHEDVYDICRSIVRGIEDGKGDYSVIVDRKKAIEYALDMADYNDIVLLGGKGAEEYQIIGDKVYKFSERDIVYSYLRR